MNCPACGNTIPEQSQFCSHCGKPLAGSAPEGVPVKCARCEGTGRQKGLFGDSSCPGCRGKGTVLVSPPPRKCPLCAGTGRQEGFINKAICGVCWGTGWADVLG